MTRRLIPKERYVSPEYLRAELKHVFPNVWLLAGIAADLTTPGAYFTFEIGADSFLVVRQPEGVRAFHNVCRHRGRRLREPGIGRARTFQCAYHGWEWSTEGQLLRVPDEESFQPALDKACLGLKEVRCEVWAGFVWLNPSGTAPPLPEFLGPLRDIVEAYHPEEFVLVEDQTLDLPCNWKVNVDAFNEVYHLHSVHPEIMGLVDDTRVQTETLGLHGRLIVPFYEPTRRRADRSQIDGGLRWLLQEAGLTESEISGSALEMAPLLKASIRRREKAGLFDTSRLTDEQLVQSHHLHLFPNFQMDLYALKLQTLRSRPHPTDPGRMLLDQWRFERLPRDRERPRRPQPERFTYGQGSLGTVTDQDMANLVRVQQGMQSSAYEGLITGDQELLIRHLHDSLDRYIPPAD